MESQMDKMINIKSKFDIQDDSHKKKILRIKSHNSNVCFDIYAN